MANWNKSKWHLVRSLTSRYCTMEVEAHFSLLYLHTWPSPKKSIFSYRTVCLGFISVRSLAFRCELQFSITEIYGLMCELLAGFKNCYETKFWVAVSVKACDSNARQRASSSTQYNDYVCHCCQPYQPFHSLCKLTSHSSNFSILSSFRFFFAFSTIAHIQPIWQNKITFCLNTIVLLRF